MGFGFVKRLSIIRQYRILSREFHDFGFVHCRYFEAKKPLRGKIIIATGLCF